MYLTAATSFLLGEKNIYCVVSLHIVYCKELNTCNSPPNLVASPVYTMNSALWCSLSRVR